jgi:hypothetical protein
MADGGAMRERTGGVVNKVVAAAGNGFRMRLEMR